MKTYFIRHNTGMDISDETRRRLWDEQRIAIHFPQQKNGKLAAKDNASVNPDDYQGQAKKCMRIFEELANDGGYVCAQHYPHEDWLLGLVNPNSKIELFNGKVAERWGDRTAVLKTLKLTKCRLVKPLDYAVLAVGRPRQGTMSRWHLAGKTVESLVEHRRSKPQLSDLTPSQQETLCSEFLRLPESKALGLPGLIHLLLPPGRTMRDIDLIGIAEDGKKLLAQVTFAPLTSVGWKCDRLLPYGPDAHLLLFCDCQQQQTQKGITIFPMQKVYDSFISTASGKLWLQSSA